MSSRGWVLFALMSVIWGVPYLMIKIAVAGVSVPMVVFTRTTVGAAVLLPLALRGGRLASLRGHAGPLLAFAALEMMVPSFLLSHAERSLTSSMCGLLVATSPIFAVVVARLSGCGERLCTARLAGLAVGLGGVAVLAGPGLGGDPWSIAEVLLVALCYGIAPLIVARRLSDVPALPMIAVCLTFAALVYATPATLTWPSDLFSRPVLLAMSLGLICTALGFVVLFALIREVGPSRALLPTYVNPAIAVSVGVFFLGEPLTPAMLVSFALILGGSVLAATPSRPASATRADRAALSVT